jgi:hypothetical protein
VDFEHLTMITVDGTKPGQARTLRYRPLDHAPHESEIAGLLSPDELRKPLARPR